LDVGLLQLTGPVRGWWSRATPKGQEAEPLRRVGGRAASEGAIGQLGCLAGAGLPLATVAMAGRGAVVAACREAAWGETVREGVVVAGGGIGFWH
jgi:hypothetical protein